MLNLRGRSVPLAPGSSLTFGMLYAVLKVRCSSSLIRADCDTVSPSLFLGQAFVVSPSNHEGVALRVFPENPEKTPAQPSTIPRSFWSDRRFQRVLKRNLRRYAAKLKSHPAFSERMMFRRWRVRGARSLSEYLTGTPFWGIEPP
jgi:hypothetical protein